MRIINPSQFAAVKLQPHQSFFLELWHNMTHNKSLDTYRIRCMNSRTIIRELSEDIDLDLINDDEYLAICAEAKSILEQDTICKKYFSNFLNIILPFLTDIPLKNPKEKGKNQRFDQIRFLVQDLSVALEQSYFSYLCKDLMDAIKPNNEHEIKSITSSLLSDLVDRGWPLETLFSWPQTFLNATSNYSFDDNLKFMLKIFQQSRQGFEVTLRISKCSSLPAIIQHGDFSFSHDAGITTPPNESVTKFMAQYQSVCFAKTRVVDFDHRSSAMNAREELEQIVDVLRFGFEPDKVSIDNICHVKRLSDDKEEIITATHILPNPTDDITHKDFSSFSNDLDTISKKNTIDSKSQRQLQAAIRQYRFGRDIDNYEDKSLYWWMGLEALARADSGPIGPTVAQNVSHCMGIIYLRQILDDFLHTLQFCEIDWPKELTECSGASDLGSLSSQQLLTVIQSEKYKKILLSLCVKHPILSYYGEILSESITDPKKTAQLLQLHLCHLQWHLSRLYRIRCCIVHGSEIRFRLRLFTANLEYYLRQIILISINTFKNYDHIHSLEELFLRASISYDRLINSLDKEDATQDTIRNAVFSDTLSIAYH